MKYTEEEKKAIEYLKENALVRLNKNNKIVAYGNSYKYYILQLLDKQQKEIERLKEHLNQYYDGKLFTSNQLKRIEKEQNKFYIHKDKIREKIKEIEDSLKEDCIALHEFQRLAKIDVLKELLGDE